MNTTISILILILVLAAFLVLLGLTRNARTIERRQKKIMNAIDRLNIALENVGNSSEAGFKAISDAMLELADDIRNIPANSDIDAAAVRAANLATTISTKATELAQAIRDAIPTVPSQDSGSEDSGTEDSGSEDPEGSGTEESGLEDEGSGTEDEGSGSEGSGVE